MRSLTIPVALVATLLPHIGLSQAVSELQSQFATLAQQGAMPFKAGGG